MRLLARSLCHHQQRCQQLRLKRLLLVSTGSLNSVFGSSGDADDDSNNNNNNSNNIATTTTLYV